MFSFGSVIFIYIFIFTVLKQKISFENRYGFSHDYVIRRIVILLMSALLIHTGIRQD